VFNNLVKILCVLTTKQKKVKLMIPTKLFIKPLLCGASVVVAGYFITALNCPVPIVVSGVALFNLWIGEI